MATLKKIAGLVALVSALSAGNAQSQAPTSNYHLKVHCDGKPTVLTEMEAGKRYRTQIVAGQSCLLSGNHYARMNSFDKIADVNKIIVKMSTNGKLADPPRANYEITPMRVPLGASFYFTADLKINQPGLYAVKVPMQTEAGATEDEYLVFNVKETATAPVPPGAPAPPPPVVSAPIPAPVPMPPPIAAPVEPVVEVDASTEIPRVGLEVALASAMFEGEVQREGERKKIEITEYSVSPSYNPIKETAVGGSIVIRTSEIAREKNTGASFNASILYQEDASSDENKVLMAGLNAGYELQDEVLRARNDDAVKNMLTLRGVFAYGDERKMTARAEVASNLDGVNKYTLELGASTLLGAKKEMELGASIVHALFVNEDRYTAAVLTFGRKGKEAAWSVSGRIGQMSGLGGELSWRMLPFLYLNAGGFFVSGEGKHTKIDASRFYGGLKFEKIDIL